MPARTRRRGNRGRIVLVVAVIALLILITSLRGLAGFYTDYLWFDSVGFSSVWRTLILSRVLLVVVASVTGAACLLFLILVAGVLFVKNRRKFDYFKHNPHKGAQFTANRKCLMT